MDEQTRINQLEWERPENWSRPFCLYRSERDTRLWVPKPNPSMGWTLNFARRGSVWTLLGLFTVPLGLILLFVMYAALG